MFHLYQYVSGRMIIFKNIKKASDPCIIIKLLLLVSSSPWISAL